MGLDNDNDNLSLHRRNWSSKTQQQQQQQHSIEVENFKSLRDKKLRRHSNIYSKFIFAFSCILIIALITTFWLNIYPNSKSKMSRLSIEDPSSFSNPEEAKVVDIHLKLEANFERHILEGSVTLTVEKTDKNAKNILLDLRELNINSVKDESTGVDLKFNISDKRSFGSKLEIELPKACDKQCKIVIEYSTAPSSSALQWLPPAQTAGKTHPYLFSQCQAIHCRSMVPLQDTPAVKSPYSAEITAPADLTVLMSAVRQGEPQVVDNGKKKVHKFLQKIPIQSYLIAIAAGKLESRKIGPRSHVWSEKELVDKAAFEFSETENMLQKAEELCGPYVWGTYDILVLPPSFPYGGMENPCLTFATPTLLAGDKSLANVIAHEIAHSWSGNLVTNKNFEHFWLNEGFTVFTERKIAGRLSPHGEEQRHFQAIGGWKELSYGINNVLGDTHEFTSLVVDLTDVDPDDAFSVVPYEKGSAFLWYLEELVGGPSKMEPFLKSYYDHFKYQSIDTNQFKEYFINFFKDEPKLNEIDWDSWLNDVGMPIEEPNYNDKLAKVCKELRDKWVSNNDNDFSNFTPEEFTNLTSGQKIEFLSLILELKPLSYKKLEKMKEIYQMNEIKNSEIRFRWIRIGLLAKWEDAVPRAVQLVTEQGRMKFLRPIYRDLYAWEEKRRVALDTFRRNKVNMMQVAVQGLEKDLKMN